MRELNYIEPLTQKYGIDIKNVEKLLSVNNKLWDIEDSLRLKEKKMQFGDEFIKLARSVYIENDIRASIKRDINIKYGSIIVEVKDYF